MPLIPCRGHERRLWLCREYEITPIAHLKLLKGQRLDSCAGGEITDNYFRFHARRRGNPEDFGDIICGYPTGCDFCDILNIDKPPLFNPLRAEPGGGGGAGGGNGGNNPAQEQWNPCMLQLSNAVKILLAYLPYREDSPLSNIQEKICNYPFCNPFPKYIKSVNTVLRNYDLTMDDVLEDIERQNGPIKDFHFNLLSRTIRDLGEEDCFSRYIDNE